MNLAANPNAHLNYNNPAARQLAEIALKRSLENLRRTTGADILTCYFRNPITRFIWNYFQDGEIYYPYTLWGPVYGPSTRRKFYEEFNIIKVDKFLDSEETLDGNEITLKASASAIETIPDWFRDKSFYCDSFATRERIQSALRITIKIESAPPRTIEPVEPEQPKKESKNQSFLIADELYLFLSFREARTIEDLEEVFEETTKHLQENFVTYLPYTVCSPFIQSERAWLLRSILENFQNKIEQAYRNLDSKTLKEQKDKTYNELSELIFKHLKPKSGENAYCALLDVGVTGKVSRGGSFPKFTDDQTILIDQSKSSICEHVAQSGSVMYVSDFAEYEARHSRHKDEWSRLKIPQIVKINAKARSQLACPVVIEDRVVAVLTIECTETHPFNNESIILFAKFADLAGTVIRQIHLYSTLMGSIAHAERLSNKSKSREEAFQLTVDFVKSTENQEEKQKNTQNLQYPHLGYEIAIWDLSSECWYPRSRDTGVNPRKGGNTHLVEQLESPIAIGDFERNEGEDITFKMWKGKLENRVLLRWEQYTNDSKNERFSISTLNSDIQKFVREHHLIASDLAFPIFDSEGKVTAVLWFKCERHFRWLLLDDSWFLSRLARNLSKHIYILEKQITSRAQGNEEWLKRTYGNSTKPNPHKLSQQLAPRYCTEVIQLRGYIPSLQSIAKNIKTNQKSVFNFRSLVSKLLEDVGSIVTKNGGAFTTEHGGIFVAHFNIISRRQREHNKTTGQSLFYETPQEKGISETNQAWLDALKCLGELQTILSPDRIIEAGKEVLGDNDGNWARTISHAKFRAAVYIGEAIVGNFSSSDSSFDHSSFFINRGSTPFDDEFLSPNTIPPAIDLQYFTTYNQTSRQFVDISNPNDECTRRKFNDMFRKEQSWILISGCPEDTLYDYLSQHEDEPISLFRLRGQQNGSTFESFFLNQAEPQRPHSLPHKNPLE